MSNKTSHRKGSIFKTVLLFHACILLFILYVNDWFVIKIPSVQKEQPNLQEKEIQNEKKIREENAKDPINERRSATNKIYLPTQKAIEKQGEKIIEDVKKQPDKAIEEKTDLASKEYSPKWKNLSMVTGFPKTRDINISALGPCTARGDTSGS